MNTTIKYPVDFLLTNLKTFTFQDNMNYTFFAKKKSDINFSKILDDLSYNDPLRIVKFKNKTFAVVHHSINDKYIRSKTSSIDFQDCIKAVVSEINNKEISAIIQNIKDIKRSKWLPIEHPDYKRNMKEGYEVVVIKPNI